MGHVSVAIVQEYVPHYRVEFFSGLVDVLWDRGIDCKVLAGHPVGTLAAREDFKSGFPWLTLANPQRLRLGSRSLYYYGRTTHWRDCAGLILELRGTSLDLHAEIAKRRFSGRRIGVWGHIKSYVQAGHPLDVVLERLQLKCSDHVFAYTESGARYAREVGVPSSRITCVMNSTDVTGLISAYQSIDDSDIKDFYRKNGLTPGKTFGYIGALDAAKRVDFLSETLDRLWDLDREIKVVVGGKGDQDYLLKRATGRGQVIPMGFVGDKEKALIMRCADALLNPGRIGLLAVESLAVGMPILTTDWPFHAPEYEYLRQGRDVFVSADTIADFASLVIDWSVKAGHETKSVLGEAVYPTLTQMIENFSQGVEAMVLG